MAKKLMKRMGAYVDDIDSGHIEHKHGNRKNKSAKVLTPEPKNSSSSRGVYRSHFSQFETGSTTLCESKSFEEKQELKIPSSKNFRKSSHGKLAIEESKQPNPEPHEQLKTSRKHRKVIYRVKGEKFVLYDYYQPVRILGHGAYAVVCEAIDLRNDRRVAIKKNKGVFTELSDAKRMLREVKLLMHFHHQDIIDLINVIAPSEDERDTFKDIYLVMPKMEINLARVIKSKQKLTNVHCQFFIYQILRGLKYIHSAGVIHRDLKPENILINGSDCKVKITDFGLARGVSPDGSNDLTEYVVTRWYRAPEIMCCARHYNEKVDVWSVGCIFAELYLRKPLFPGSNHIELLRLIFTVLGTPPKSNLEWVKTPQARQWIEQMLPVKPKNMNRIFRMAEPLAVDLIAKMLVINPNQRISVDAALSHPYLEQLHHPPSEPLCKTFDLSFEFENSINTQFGVRHKMYEILNEFSSHRRHRLKSNDQKRTQRAMSKPSSSSGSLAELYENRPSTG